jgi:hypothetical protein
MKTIRLVACLILCCSFLVLVHSVVAQTSTPTPTPIPALPSMLEEKVTSPEDSLRDTEATDTAIAEPTMELLSQEDLPAVEIDVAEMIVEPLIQEDLPATGTAKACQESESLSSEDTFVEDLPAPETAEAWSELASMEDVRTTGTQLAELEWQTRFLEDLPITQTAKAESPEH